MIRRTLAILLCLLLAGTVLAALPAFGETRRLGDLNGSGAIDAKDYAMIKRYVLHTYELDETQLLLADINQDGTVDAKDYVLAKRTVLGTYSVSETIELSPSGVNLVQGVLYKVETEGKRTDGYGDFYEDGGSHCRYRLTDGIASSSGDDRNLICGYNDDTVSFFFDLGQVCKIREWTTDVWGGCWGIGDPSDAHVTISGSLDGKSYLPIDGVGPAPGSAEPVGTFKKRTVGRTLSSPTRARYLRVDYECGTFVWTSELSVYGDREAEDTSIPRVDIMTSDSIKKDDYVSCSLKIVDPSCTFDTLLDVDSQIKIRGNSTSSGEKKPYNVKFSKKSDVLGMGKAKKWYLLANLYDKTQIRNKLSFDFANDIGMAYVQQSTFVRVYLNGVYQGIYQLCESIGTGESRVDIDPKGNEFLLEYEPWTNYANDYWIRTPRYNILLGFNEPDEPTDAQRTWLTDFFTKAENAIHNRKYSEIAKYLDIDSFVDDYIVQEYFKQVDYSTSSTRFYIKDGMWYAGPVWDFDLSSGNCSSSYYTNYNNVGGSGNSWEGFYCLGLWNSKLFEVPEFKQRFLDRYKELQPYIVNLYQDNELGKCRIDQLLDRFGDEIALNYTVWSTRKTYSGLEREPTDGTYASEITYLKKWLKNRNEWMLNYFGIE